MQSFIIEGNKEAQEAHIKQFIQNHNLYSYNITRINLAKISEIRSLQKTLHVKLSQRESRLIILEQAPTIEAQNALLKLLEEPPPYTFLFITVFSKEELLPTVVSRCTIIRITNKETSDVEINEQNPLLNFLTLHHIRSCDDIFRLSALLMLDQSSSDVSSVILSIRRLLLYVLLEDKRLTQKNVYFLAYFLHNLCELYPLIKHNNLNAKFCIEHALLKSLDR